MALVNGKFQILVLLVLTPSCRFNYLAKKFTSYIKFQLTNQYVLNSFAEILNWNCRPINNTSTKSENFQCVTLISNLS